jgi:CRP-like cAMP-binding protein
VTIKSDFGLSDQTSSATSTKRVFLYDGDHFGEIGLIFNSKRTATVKSLNYGSLAKLDKSGFNDLSKQFPSLTTAFKEYIFKYKDDLRTFLEMECDKIRYFRDLSMITKQELMYNMERKTYKEG